MLTGILILLPLLASIFVMFSANERQTKIKAILSSIVIFLFSIFLLANFNNSGLPEHTFSFPWIPGAGINFSFAIDGFSLLMILLTTLTVPLILLSQWNFIGKKLNIFYGLILIMESALIGVFTSQDLLVFYLFWELTLIPAYFITAIWGGKNSIKITFKFFIYTLFGSLIMLAAIVYLYFLTPGSHSFGFEEVFGALTNKSQQMWIFGAFFLAFAIKIPIFPFHTWQPDTYTEAPPAGSMLLAGLMLKMGLFAIIRILIPLTPLALKYFALPSIILAVIGIVYASIIAIKQTDLKRMVAYMSIAHVGLIAAGCLAFNINSLQGSVFQMFAHGLNVIGLFIVIDIIQRKFGTRLINELGGLAHKIPALAILFMIILLGSIALPLTNGFIGEFLILYGLSSFNIWLTAIAGTTIFFGAVYMFWMFQRVMLGKKDMNVNQEAIKLEWYEWAALLPICSLIILTGIFPKIILQLTEPAIYQIINSINLKTW